MPVHLRLNDKDTSRNPFINFVTALPGPRHDEALHRLQQLAAMAKPLMKDQGFHINSLEEYEHNSEFAGRCWNNGETIELVLTSADGSWISLQYVLYVFCHELAHIKHMNHIPNLHGALTRHLKELALSKQRQGYFGDGLWSSGRQLQGGGFVAGSGMDQANDQLPLHVCGGAFRRPRANGRRRRGQRKRANGVGKNKFKGPSLHTGAQTASNTKGGNRRVKLGVQEQEGSSGSRVDGRDWFPAANAKSKDYKLDDNSTFRKRTQSKEGREKRASAALARLAALQTNTIKSEAGAPTGKEKVEEDSGEDSVSEEESGDEDGRSADDDWLVGNDLGEGERVDVKGEDDCQSLQYTQADSSETAEQRRRRRERFDRKHGSTTLDNSGWDLLLGQDANGGKKRKAKKEEESSDDDVVVVHQTSKQRLQPSSKPPARVERQPADWSEWEAVHRRCPAKLRQSLISLPTSSPLPTSPPLPTF